MKKIIPFFKTKINWKLFFSMFIYHLAICFYFSLVFNISNEKTLIDDFIIYTVAYFSLMLPIFYILPIKKHE